MGKIISSLEVLIPLGPQVKEKRYIVSRVEIDRGFGVEPFVFIESRIVNGE